jgi:hypothetical protein
MTAAAATGDRTHSYDPGEQLRVSRDSSGTLVVHHGANAMATIKQAIGGGVRIEADGRSWRLKTTDEGWEAEGDPPAALRHRTLRSDVLTVGRADYAVRGQRVKGLLSFRTETAGNGRRRLVADILESPPPGTDAHALVVLATAAVVLAADLTSSSVHDGVNGDNMSAALRYGLGR